MAKKLAPGGIERIFNKMYKSGVNQLFEVNEATGRSNKTEYYKLN